MSSIDLSQSGYLTLARQHLTPESRIDDLVRVAGDVGGLHATGVATPYLSLFARTRRFQRDDLDRELYEHRTLVKIRCVRKTIYVHPLHVVPFAFRATVDTVTQGSARYMEARGVASAQFEAISQEVIALLQGQEMTAAEIKQALQTRLDISVVLNLLCDQGVLVRGKPEKSWRDRRQAYALLADYFPDLDLGQMDRREATRLLVRHYLAAFGPVREKDIVWWTALGVRQVREALADLADEVTRTTIAGLDGQFVVLRAWLEQMRNTTAPDQPVVNLLPVLDPFLMGYKDRARYVDDSDQDFVFDRSGNGTSTILVSGRVAGVWDIEEKPVPAIKFLLFHPVVPDVRETLYGEARALGRFYFGCEVQVRQCTSMVPLTRRTAGSMMSPLKGCPAEDVG